MRFSNASGRLMIGSRAHEVVGPSAVELKNIRWMRASEDVIPVTVQMAEDGAGKFSLQGRADVYVNGERLQAGKGRDSIEILLILCSLVSGVAALTTIVQVSWERTKRKKRAQTEERAKN